MIHSAGERKNGYILGRGTLDDKGMGVMGLMALLLAKRTGLQLKRDVVFLATADEETGGEYGAGYMAREHADKLAATFLLNEGGALMRGVLPNDRVSCMVAVGEKGPLWLELSRPGTSGHGSVPVADNAILKLVAGGRPALQGGPAHPVHRRNDRILRRSRRRDRRAKGRAAQGRSRPVSQAA